MKYTKMVCWVNQSEQEALIDANKNNHIIIFVNVQNIVRSFPDIRFYAMRRLDERALSRTEFEFLLEPNVNRKNRRSNYAASELVDLFEGRDIID